jgi:ubiquinone/menaquinone biosynthesis C-methylase UbiE
MKRTVTPEWLDTDAGTREEVRSSLADLRLVNRWFGGASTMCSLLERVALRTGAQRLEVLDVASASGDIPVMALNQLRNRGIELQVTLLDRAASHMNGSFRAVVGDALALPFADESFDVVSCSLFAHHLEPDELRQFAREALRIARSAVLINDLRRNLLHLAFVYAALPLFSRLTRHDAPISIRRSYTPEEMRAILSEAHPGEIEIHRHYFFRIGLIAWKRPR